MDTATRFIFFTELVGAAAYTVALLVALGRQSSTSVILKAQLRLPVFPFFAGVAALLFLLVSLGGLASASLGDFVPVYYTVHSGQFSPLPQLVATLWYVTAAVAAAPSWVVAGWLFDKARVTNQGRWTVLGLGLIFVGIVLSLGYDVLKGSIGR